MQFGSRTLAEWQRDLHAPAPRASRAARSPTWAQRAAAAASGVAHARRVPRPRRRAAAPPPPPPPPDPPAPPSPAASASASAPSPPVSPAAAPEQPAPAPAPAPLLQHRHDRRPQPSPASSPASSSRTPPPTSPPNPPVTKRRRRPPRALPPPHRQLPPLPPLPPRALRGLVNCGNSCFTNVVLQALLACDQFRRLLLRCSHLLGLDAQSAGDAPQTLLAKFVRLADEMTASHAGPAAQANGHAHASGKPKVKENGFVAGEPLVADWFYDVFPGSGVAPPSTGGVGPGGSQEDAEEFLSFVLNALHEELVDMDKNAAEDSDEYDDDDCDLSPQKTNGHKPGVANGVVGSATLPASAGNGVWNGVNHALDNREGNGVWEEITRKGKTVEIRGGEFAQTGVTDIFGGNLRSEVKRGRAKPSVTREPFFTLSLDIESGMIRDVENALAAYFEPEQLEGYTMEVASRGGEETVVEARKQVLLQNLPQVLVLHLKRFSHNSVTGALNKVSRLMGFPETFDVPGQFVHGNVGETRYALTAVVTHLGKELAGGHYTCDVRWGGAESEVWVSCDDSKVVRTSLQKVLRKQAYLLFYSLKAGRGGREMG